MLAKPLQEAKVRTSNAKFHSGNHVLASDAKILGTSSAQHGREAMASKALHSAAIVSSARPAGEIHGQTDIVMDVEVDCTLLREQKKSALRWQHQVK